MAQDRINVRRLRESMGHTQESFSDLIGVGERTIRRWEAREFEPSPMARRQLRRAQLNYQREQGDGQQSVASDPATTEPKRRGLEQSSSGRPGAFFPSSGT